MAADIRPKDKTELDAAGAGVEVTKDVMVAVASAPVDRKDKEPSTQGAHSGAR